jgi:N-glycosylase/DNA lyase
MYGGACNSLSAVTCNNTPGARLRRQWKVADYDLDATIESGQAFRWRPQDGGWLGVVAERWVYLKNSSGRIDAGVAVPCGNWRWLEEYLQLDVDYAQVIRGLPGDEPMRRAMECCHGLRLLRQDPWECLASFILSSTKQIVQIQQVIELLCQRFGTPIGVPPGFPSVNAFPTAGRLASASEGELRECKMGFRAPYLLEAARRIADGRFCLDALSSLSMIEARQRLMELPGVGRKIADCVLLFSLGFAQAFPVDVWIQKALQECYFHKDQKISLAQMHSLVETHFGPWAGYAQQYLFHYFRVIQRKS